MIKLGLGLSMVAVFAFGCGGDDEADAGPTGSDAAAATTFDVALTPAAEVPPCTGGAGAATGDATVTISADNTSVAVQLTWAGLSGDASAAHIHFGAAGVAGGVIFPLGMPPVSPVNATFTSADYPNPPPDGAPADFAAFVTAMKAGMSYINVHSAACMPGEIRGQISN
jgi:hypothetical protein